jgi:DNA-binding CsgD family transcriptional regulator
VATSWLGDTDASLAAREQAFRAHRSAGNAGGAMRIAGWLANDALKLVAQGLSDAEIAERLVVSPHTVHRHVANVRTKLRLPSRAAAVAYATREGLL